MKLVNGKKSHRTLAFARHGRHGRIGRVQDGGAMWRHVLHNHALENCEILHRGDVIQPQMVTAADVGHNSNIAAVKSEAFP